MKNLLIYLNPKGFDEEHKKLSPLQIDNCLELGWNRKDIVLITDFNYTYNGVKAIQIDKGFVDFKNTATKIPVIVEMFKRGMIEDDVYWCHDMDAYQLIPFSEKELGLNGVDVGLCDYGRKPNWQMGSFFFKNTASDIFNENARRLKPGLDHNRRPMHDEYAMIDMTNENWNGINSRIKRMNITYDFGMRKVGLCYKKAIKPLRVLHFHPHSDKLNNLKIVMSKENDIGKPLMNERLIKLFNKYGYK